MEALCDNAQVAHHSDAPLAQAPTSAPPLDDAWPVIPLFNEGPVIRKVVESVRQVFPHVVVVDDGSQDDSVQQARLAGATVLRHPINLGQGAALQTGFQYLLERTDARYAVTFDADGQHRVQDAAAMVQAARSEDLGFVLGSRFLDGSTKVSLAKRAVLGAATWVSSRSTGMRLTDAHNGLRVLRRDAMARLELSQNRMAHASEIINQLARTGLPWREHPVQIAYTDYSKAKGQSLWNSVNILVDLVFS